MTLQLPWDTDGVYVVTRDGFVTVANCYSAGSRTDIPVAKERAALIAKAVNAHDDLVSALTGILDRYTELVNSGDAGNWDPEREEPVIAARTALAKALSK